MDRERDRYGRPLPHDADPSRIVPSVPERDVITGVQAWNEALDYLSRDQPFHAHEVFEQRWRCAPESERACWKALAQWGAALTHRARGNSVGAQRVAERAMHGLQQATEVPTIVDVQRVSESCAELIRG
jgi:hypothetical protein